MILTQKGSLRFICRNVIFPLSLSFVYSIWRLGSFLGQQEDEGMLLSCCIYRFDIYFGVSQNLKFFHAFQACTIALETFSVSHLVKAFRFT